MTIGDKHGEVKILAVVGMSGSGKSVVVEHMTEKGYPNVYFGGMVLAELERRGLPRTAENEKFVREDVREKYGKDWVVRQVIEATKRLIEAGQRRIVLDGVYSYTEYKILKEEFPGDITFLAVVLPKKLRYKRVGERLERPFNGQEIRDRDDAEIMNLEKGGPIAAADFYVMNDGTIQELCDGVDGVLEEIGW